MLTVLAQTPVVDLVVPAREGVAHGGLAWVWAAAAALCIVVAACILLVRRRAEHPSEAAFRKLCRASGLGSAERRALREMAARAGIERPVALLLSREALSRAASGGSGIEAQLVAKLGA